MRADWFKNTSWMDKYLTEAGELLKPAVELKIPQRMIKTVSVTADTLACDVARALIALGCPVEFRHNPMTNEVEIRWMMNEADRMVSELAKERARSRELLDELDRVRDKYRGADAAAMELFRENEQLKKDLEEARALSLF